MSVQSQACIIYDCRLLLYIIFAFWLLFCTYIKPYVFYFAFDIPGPLITNYMLWDFAKSLDLWWRVILLAIKPQFQSIYS